MRGSGVRAVVSSAGDAIDVVHCVLFRGSITGSFDAKQVGGKPVAVAEYQRECLQSAAWGGEED